MTLSKAEKLTFVRMKFEVKIQHVLFGGVLQRNKTTMPQQVKEKKEGKSECFIADWVRSRLSNGEHSVCVGSKTVADDKAE